MCHLLARSASKGQLSRPCLRCGLVKGSEDLADVKRADVAAAAVAVAPGLAEALAAEGVLNHAGRACLDVGGQRRVEGELVAAHLVVIAVEAARLHLGDAGVQLEAGVLLARAAVD